MSFCHIQFFIISSASASSPYHPSSINIISNLSFYTLHISLYSINHNSHCPLLFLIPLLPPPLHSTFNKQSFILRLHHRSHSPLALPNIHLHCHHYTYSPSTSFTASTNHSPPLTRSSPHTNHPINAMQIINILIKHQQGR